MKAMFRNSVLAVALAVTSFASLPAEAAAPMPLPTMERGDVELVRHRGYCSPREACAGPGAWASIAPGSSGSPIPVSSWSVGAAGI